MTEHEEREALVSRQAAALEQCPGAMVLADVGGRIEHVNLRFVELTGRVPGDVVGGHLAGLAGAAERAVVRDHVARAAAGVAWSGELAGVRADGSAYWAGVRLVPVRDADDAVTHLLWAFEDVTENLRLRERVAYLGAYDPLTGLANRDLLLRRVREAMAGVSALPRRGAALIVVEIGGLAAVNQAWGHEAGDRLLVQVTERVQATVHPGDVIARLSGSRFALLCAPVRRRQDAVAIATRLQTALAAPFDVDGQEAVVHVLLGVALAPADAADAGALLRRADVALEQARSDPRGRVRFFTDDLSDQATDDLRLQAEMRRGLGRGEFVAAYQPRVELDGGRVVGFEALARWRHPIDGLILPARFMPVAERSGLVVGLDAEIARQAIAQARAWFDDGVEPGRLSVNLSALDLADPALGDRLFALLDDAGLAYERLEVEVTETSAIRATEGGIATLAGLRERGVGVALDDFGVDYSSLRHLQRLPVTTVKIDRSFVAELATPGGAAIVKAVIGIGAELGLQVVAEGVETEAQRVQLLEFGCRHCQGYLFGRPLDAADATQRMRQQRGAPQLVGGSGPEAQWAARMPPTPTIG